MHQAKGATSGCAMINVSELIEKLNTNGILAGTSGPLDTKIGKVTNDSRQAGPGDLFIAIRGVESDGHLFIDKAVKNGAIAIVHEMASEETALQSSSDVVSVHVTDSRIAEAVIASHANGRPADQLQIAGITGTNGKTSTVYLTRNLLDQTGIPTGIIGTVECSTGKRSYSSGQTTPGPLQMHKLFREMVEDDCKVCMMEVSSHALQQKRTYGIDFTVAAFTNLTQDHLDYHRDFQDYFETKKRLFDGLSANATAVTNVDDPYGKAIVADTRANVITYGMSPEADNRLEILSQEYDGLSIALNGKQGRFRLVGEFNAHNIACSFATALALGIPEEDAFEKLQDAPRIPGRFEPVWTDDGRLIIIDYAHTPDALQKALETLNKMNTKGGLIWCIFGCGGDRDKTKRPLMGEIAARLSDKVVVTSDNPRTENPDAIIRDVMKGIPGTTDVETIADRRKAVQFAAANSAPGDIILLAGKGHETYQIVGTERLHCDDPEIVRHAFNVSGSTL